MCVYIYIYIYIYISLYTYKYIHIHIHMYRPLVLRPLRDVGADRLAEAGHRGAYFT